VTAAAVTTRRLMGDHPPLMALVEPTLADMGYALVRLLVMGKHRKIVQVMAERQDGADMTVEDCEAISRGLSAVLDVNDPIQDAYDLEVSSPGIDRPLSRPEDFDRYAGHEVRIEADTTVDGRRRVKGMLVGRPDEGTILVRAAEPGPDGERDWRVPLGLLTKAKLVMTDDLLRATMKADKAARKGRSPDNDPDMIEQDDSAGTDA